MAEINEMIGRLLAGKDLPGQVAVLNEIKQAMRVLSPFKNEPVDLVIWVPAELVQANSYNPNKVASPEMKLLHESIASDGYTQPVVTYKLPNGHYEIVDGFHRNRIGRECPDVAARIHGFLPLVMIDKPLDERIGSTIRHNRARGTHQIRSMSEIIISLVKEGWDDAKIGQKLGMSQDEVLRLKQISGLKEAFSNHEFSKSWDEFETKYYPAEKGKAGKTVSKKPIKKKS